MLGLRFRLWRYRWDERACLAPGAKSCELSLHRALQLGSNIFSGPGKFIEL